MTDGSQALKTNLKVAATEPKHMASNGLQCRSSQPPSLRPNYPQPQLDVAPDLDEAKGCLAELMLRMQTIPAIGRIREAPCHRHRCLSTWPNKIEDVSQRADMVEGQVLCPLAVVERLAVRAQRTAPTRHPAETVLRSQLPRLEQLHIPIPPTISECPTSARTLLRDHHHVMKVRIP